MLRMKYNSQSLACKQKQRCGWLGLFKNTETDHVTKFLKCTKRHWDAFLLYFFQPRFFFRLFITFKFFAVSVAFHAMLDRVKRRLSRFTPWFRMVNTVPPSWVATNWRNWSVLKPPFSQTAKEKVSMCWVATPLHPRHGLALWATMKRIASPATPESDLVLEDIQITPTRVETWLSTAEIVETNSSRPWDTSSFNLHSGNFSKIQGRSWTVNVRKWEGQSLTGNYFQTNIAICNGNWNRGYYVAV